MLKKIVSLAMTVTAVFCMNAQTPLPENPNVLHGTLPNGLNYYILHNSEPKERANFYIAQKVGSTLEAPEQLGLAHFLEHMAFNGTKNFPGKNMLNYLQSKGIRFGADINAYTGFDETVYRINNVPTTDQALMDSVLLVLHDWSCDLTLDTEEINAERGVIQEEWRGRNDANTRQMTAMLPAIYDEYQYHQMPIGSMDVVMNFDPQVLRDYYHKWYRPDQQGIVVVGDFDAKEMEKKVIALFSPIPMPENAAPRLYPEVSDNTEPIYFEFQDPELTYTMARLAFKSDKTPFEMRNTLEGFMGDELLPEVVSMLINHRLQDFAKEADCKYADAGVFCGDYYVSKTKDAFYVVAIAKDDIQEAFRQVMQIVARACKTGFTDSELTRVKDEILATYEKRYNERNTTKSDPLAQEIIRHFIDNKPAPGIETEKQMVEAILSQIPVQAINQMCSMMLTPENQVLVVTGPTSAGQLPGRNVMLGEVNTAMGAEYEAFVDEVITDPLIPKYLKAGKVKSTTQNAELGTTELTLSNGVKVVVKPTDFSSDQILMTAFRNGGKRAYATSESANLNLIDIVYDAVRIGSFDSKMLEKYLAGKNVSLSYNMGVYTEMFEGQSTVKDLETLLDLTYASFTAVGPDQATYDAQMSRLAAQLKMAANNPNYEFQVQQMRSIYGNNPMMQAMSPSIIEQANYARMIEIFRASTANAADYTFVFTGNVDVATLTPMLEKYIASLPSKKKASAAKVVTPIEIAQGNVENFFDVKMQTPSTLFLDIYSGDLPFSIKNEEMVDMAGEVLGNIFTETLREEEGGSYSPSAYGQYNPASGKYMLIEVVQTNSDIQDKMMRRAHEETLKLLANGATADQFGKVKEAAIKQLEMSERNNKYWNNGLVSWLRGWNTLSGHRQALESITLEEFNAFLKTLWNGKDRIQVVMTGVPEEK